MPVQGEVASLAGGRARRGGIAGRALLQQLTREEEKEDEGGDSDNSVSSDLGPMIDLTL